MNAVKFIREVRQEAGKVIWPTRKETTASTMLVLCLVLLSAFFFWLVDSVIAYAVKTILGLGGA